MAASQPHAQVSAVNITSDFIDSCNDYTSYTVISTVKILPQNLTNSMVQALKENTHTRKHLWGKILFAYTVNVGFNNFSKGAVTPCFFFSSGIL